MVSSDPELSLRIDTSSSSLPEGVAPFGARVFAHVSVGAGAALFHNCDLGPGNPRRLRRYVDLSLLPALEIPRHPQDNADRSVKGEIVLACVEAGVRYVLRIQTGVDGAALCDEIRDADSCLYQVHEWSARARLANSAADPQIGAAGRDRGIYPGHESPTTEVREVSI
jgi:hypothetical protein